MTAPISLSALRAALTRVTPGEWMVDARFGPAHIQAGSLDASGYVGAVRRDPDAFAIVATHNAADVLVEIAEAALALRDSRCDCTTEFHDSTAQVCPMGQTERRLEVVLAKVSP